ncbi:BZ3500_MvSof-1268-A1-R1_Chr8-2g10086 [Microbotryum saponariae]|nr:BZ3500_MvSof-1268-A1-R1_Chr8-2g10086 [Microbotryum saponariae]SDA01755.1 BZ3501_MvSof-1269-A2-R1_Chr8-2g09837 [Microbotryum saponariae]
MPHFVAATTFVRYTRSTLLTGSLLHSPPRFRLASTMSIPSKMKACQIREQGGLDVIQVTEVDVPQPAKGQVLYEVQWAG